MSVYLNLTHALNRSATTAGQEINFIPENLGKNLRLSDFRLVIFSSRLKIAGYISRKALNFGSFQNHV